MHVSKKIRLFDIHLAPLRRLLAFPFLVFKKKKYVRKTHIPPPHVSSGPTLSGSSFKLKLKYIFQNQIYAKSSQKRMRWTKHFKKCNDILINVDYCKSCLNLKINNTKTMFSKLTLIFDFSNVTTFYYQKFFA